MRAEATTSNARARKSTRKPPAAHVQAPPDDPLAGKLVVRLSDAFAILGVGSTKGFELIKDGRLRVVKIDKRTLAYTSSIRELLGIAA
jgi:hypothetical protein